MGNIFKHLIFLALIFGMAISAMAVNEVKIDVGEAKAKKSLMALTPLKYLGGQPTKANANLGQYLYNVIQNDLNTSSYFRFISPQAYIEKPNRVGLKPAPGEKNGFNYANWKALGAEFLLRAGYRVLGDKIELETYLYYVPQAKVILTKTYQSPKDKITSRKLAHTFTSDIIKRLTGKPAMFNSKVVFSSDRSGHKEIHIMDWDGFNLKKITNHRSIALSPSWSPDGKAVAYTAYAYHPKIKSKNADLFIYELKPKKRWLVSYRRGINSGASFLPGGRELLLTISRRGNPDVFRINRDGKILKRLTRGPNRAMNVEPIVSPDGSKVAFSSDRSGHPMIYVMSIQGRSVKRVTYAGRYNASPSWSPDGSKIAFAGHDKKHFDIFIMNSNGTNLKRLTSAKRRNGRWANNEDPTFSPDGRHIMFSSNRTGKNQLYLIDIDGNNEKRITFDKYNYFKPKWSSIME